MLAWDVVMIATNEDGIHLVLIANTMTVNRRSQINLILLMKTCFTSVIT